MIKRINIYSLRYRMVIALVISVAIAGVVYFVFSTGSTYLINRYYLSSEAYEQRTDQYAKRFQSYVEKNGLSTTDQEALQAWVLQNPYAYMTIYGPQGIIWESGWWDDKGSNYTAIQAESESGTEITVEESQIDMQIASSGSMDAVVDYSDWAYETKFKDGIFWISVTDFSDEPIFDLVSKLVIGFSVFLIFPIVLIYSGKISKRVIRLTKEVKIISSGQLDGVITIKGRDEIALLADGVDTMRRSVIEQLEKEQIAWRANSDLITSMSHDIRTPLTVLLGYTGILKNKQYASKEELDSYVEVIDKKAIQLKELSDKLFRYFLVFGDTGPISLEAVSAQEVLSQAIGEHAVLLMDNGFKIEHIPLGEDCIIQVESSLFKRLFDNIFSNIEKYADQNIPCHIDSAVAENKLKVRISNGIRKEGPKAESTKIGLKTCSRAMEQMGGSFKTHSDSEEFVVELIFPAVELTEE